MSKCSHSNKKTIVVDKKRVVICKDCGETIKVVAMD